MADSVRIHVGVAGWSYADWRDTVYRLPPKMVQLDLFGDAQSGRSKHVSDELAFLAQYVDMIEINNSFYRIPSARNAESWVRRAAAKPDFFFTAKLNQDFTHGFQRSKPLAREFRTGLGPLTESGRLRGLLAQFRYDFADSPETRRLIEWIHGEFADFAPLIVEVRHKSWESPAALEFLRGLEVTVANLDYPTAPDSFDLAKCTVGDPAYLRLHGRNREAWFSREATVDETYNYDYSDAEINELADRSRSILGDVKELTIVANNHYQGKAVSAALRLKAQLTGRKLPVPPGLVETYPHLKRILEG